MRLFLGGSHGLVLFEDSELTQLHDAPVLCAAKASPARVVAGTEKGSILLWEGNGDARVTAKDVGDEVHGLAVAANGAVFAGTLPAAVWFSKDGGDIWKELPAFSTAPNSESWKGGNSPGLASALACHPKDPKTVYCGVESGGLYRSRDAGKKWFDLEIPGPSIHCVQVSPAKHERVFVTTAQGAFCSDDEGFSWKPMGVNNQRQCTLGVAAHPSEADRVIISATEGAPATWGGRSGAKCEIYLSTDSGRRFRTVVKNLKAGVQRKALVINPKVPSEVAFGTTDGDLYYSNDGGESFDVVGTKLGDLKTVIFA